jgi:hypothetical protein
VSANVHLCAVYGTKEAQVLPTAVQLGSALLGYKFLQAQEARIEQLRIEAQIMNERARVLEARKMRATRRNLERAPGGIMPDTTHYGDISLAEYERALAPLRGPLFPKEGSARKLARASMSGMDKEAIGGAFFGRLLAGAGKMLGGAGRRAAGAGFGRVGGGMRRAGVGMRARGGRMMRAAPAPKVPAAAAPAAGGQGFFARAFGGGGAAAAPKRKPWKLMGWKGKGAIAGLGLLGAGTYLGGKAIGATRDVMMQRPGGWHGGAYPMLRHNVSGYGGGYAY